MQVSEWISRNRGLDQLRDVRLLHVPTPGDRHGAVAAGAAFAALMDSRLMADYHNAGRYYDMIDAHGVTEATRYLESVASTQQPTIVLFQNPDTYPVLARTIRNLRCLPSRPSIGYDEKDAALLPEGLLDRGRRTLGRMADIVFLCGLGKNLATFRLLGQRRFSYSPSEADTTRFGSPWQPTSNRSYDVALFGNRRTSRWSDRGATEREQLIRLLDGDREIRFGLFGRGWDDISSSEGPVEYPQLERIARASWLTVGWNHTQIPGYFSNRLPTMLLTGVAHVSNALPGYSHLFEGGKHLHLVADVGEAYATIVELLAPINRATIIATGKAGAEWAMSHYTSIQVYAQQLLELADIRGNARLTSEQR